MARLPVPGSDDGTWGEVLNDYLSVSHAADGTLKAGLVSDPQVSSLSQSKITNLTSDLAAKADDTTVVHLTGNETLTDKRITPRVISVASSATPAPNADTTDMYILTALGVAATFGAPTGTPTEGQNLIIRVKDNGTARVLAWNAIYRAIGLVLPTTTVAGKTLYVGCRYNALDTRWDVIAIAQE